MMIAETMADIQPMLPKLTACAISFLLVIAAAVLLGIVLDEWLQIRRLEKDMKQRREKIEKLIAAQNESRQQELAEQTAKQKKSLRQLLPLSGCLWHNS